MDENIAMTDRSLATLTNIDTGPRGLDTAAGLIMLDAGAEIGLDLSAGELAAATASGWFAVATVDVAANARRRAR